MKCLLPFLLVFLFLSCNQKKEQLPNIVILYADDMGYGDLAIQNPEAKLTTPNLDKLASEGIRFTDGHSSSGICSPSRFALLTGQYHWRRFHDIVGPFGPSKFVDSDFTLPEMLKEYGYSTACIGKWHLGWDWESLKKADAKAEPLSETDKRMAFGPEDFDWSKPIPDGPTAHGFDYYFGDGTINFPPYTFVENDKVYEVPTENFDLTGMKTKEGSWEFRPGPMAKDWNPYNVLPTLKDKAVEWIENQGDETPFFLYMPFPSPHAPIIPSDEFNGKTEAGAYGDFVFQTDYVAGEILKALDRKGFTENTLVIFTSDNGPEQYAYPRIRNFDHYSMGHLRGLKRDIYEGGHRVPFVVKWPGKIEEGVVSDVLIHQVDIFRTINAIFELGGNGTGYSVMGTRLPDTIAIDGVDQLPYLLGETDSALRTTAVQNTFTDGFVMRSGDWVLIERFSGHHTRVPRWFLEENGYEPIDKTVEGQLFNLKDDPSQKINLYLENQDKVLELSTLLEAERNRSTVLEN